MVNFLETQLFDHRYSYTKMIKITLETNWLEISKNILILMYITEILMTSMKNSEMIINNILELLPII